MKMWKKNWGKYESRIMFIELFDKSRFKNATGFVTSDFA